MRLKALSAAALAGTLALAACGDDGNDDESTATTAEAAIAEAATATTEAMASETTVAMDQPGDIVAVASSTEGFSTLVAAVTAAGLVETLQGPGPFTVFAPTDEAFAALPAGTLDALLLPENSEVLTKILTYHVVSGEVLAADVTAGDVATVEGQAITVSTDGGVRVNDSNVIATDVMASNGVIHVIDAVLLPPDVDVAAL
jgi:uncharacterized surface protein with fasciclin (FAS1) repeats